MATVEPRSLTATVQMHASPAEVWRVIADVRRTGEWSPECVAVTPLGQLRTGTILWGRNRRGRVRWATLSRVIEYQPEVAIAWRVLTNRSEWRYLLEPTGSGTSVTQTRRTPRGEGRFAIWFTNRFLGGQRDHDDELEAGMAEGLQRIQAIVEAGRVAAV